MLRIIAVARVGSDARPDNRKMATLLDVISALASADSEATIYAAIPIEPHSAAMVCVESEDGASPTGLSYLLEVDLARDVLDVWARWRDGQEPTPEEATQAVIYYAVHDAYEPLQPTG
jgi:hypothetical protein